MIISTQHRFVYLANRKCASSSLTFALRRYGDVIAESNPRIRHTNYATYQRYVRPWVEQCTDQDMEEFDVFTLFREPTEWLHSWFRFRTRSDLSEPTHPQHDEFTGHVSWGQFLEAYCSSKPPKFAQVGRQSDFVLGSDGGIGPNRLMAFDNLDQMLAELSARLGTDLKPRNFNTSPEAASPLSADDYLTGRAMMPDEYDIYDSVAL